MPGRGGPLAAVRAAELRGVDLPTPGSARPATLQRYCRSAGSRSETGPRPPPPGLRREVPHRVSLGEEAASPSATQGDQHALFLSCRDNSQKPAAPRLRGGQRSVQRPAAPCEALASTTASTSIRNALRPGVQPSPSFHSGHANRCSEAHRRRHYLAHANPPCTEAPEPTPPTASHRHAR